MRSTKRTARLAGFIYLVFAIVSVYAFLYVPSAVTVTGDATATANNIIASQLLFRSGILVGLISQVMFIFLVVVLYRLFEQVDRTQALLMVSLVVAGVAATFANMFNRIAALLVLSGADFLSVFDKPQLEALAYAFLRLYGQAGDAIEMFWGLWLFPFGLLVIRSRFIPRFLGIALFVAGVGYTLNSFAALLGPQYKGMISQLTTLLAMGELPIVVWLLIWGTKEQPVGVVPSRQPAS